MTDKPRGTMGTYAPDDSDIYELYTRRSRCANTPKEDGV